MIEVAAAAASRLWWWGAGFLMLLGLTAISLWSAYDHGRGVEGASWQSRWTERDALEAAAQLRAAQDERRKEQAHQKAIDQVQQNAEKQIDTALTQVADAVNAADGLRSRVNQLLAADRERRNSCASPGGSSAENPGNLLAVVLDKSVARNRELAALADSARIAGLACEAAYSALRGSP